MNLTYAGALQKALVKNLGSDKVVLMKDWKKKYTGEWLGAKKKPVALVLHHTAGAATTSTDPKHPGNKKGANDGVIRFVQTHYPVPAANFTLDRDGTVYVHAAYPIWHAGLGQFKKGTEWESLNIPKDMGNRYMLGVEIVSRGQNPDFTEAQKKSLAKLQKACGEASGWANCGTLYHPRHKDWAPTRKVDIKYSQAEVNKWMNGL